MASHAGAGLRRLLRNGKGFLLPFLICLASSIYAAGLQPVHLRTEYLTNPLGLDMLHPRLNWEFEAASRPEHGLRQTAYQILVASEPGLLQPDRADLWNSGEVVSDRTAHIEYGGRTLASRERCFWTVRGRDQDSRWSGWSKPARWTMGLLDPADWTAKWIGTGESFTRTNEWRPDNRMPDPWFRKAFTLSSKPHRATAFVASVGYHELFINGLKVGSAVLEPSVTDNSKRARYEAYEIAELLRPGTNVIGLWLGTGWSIFPKFQTPDKPRAPIVIGQFDIDLPDGSTQRLVTDEGWKMHPSPNTLLGSWDFMNFGGELYDANKEVPDWCESSLDESRWRPAQVFRPKLTISADCVEPNRLITELRPANISESKPGVYRIDMGKNFAGFSNIAVKGKPGDRIEIQFSERASESMTHRLHDVYLIGETGKGKFENRFNYGVGRWISISGLKRKPALSGIRGWLVRTDYERAADFECSNLLLNQIYATTLWTLENLTLGGYSVDCPHRERMGYGGDAHATTFTALNNYRMGAFYTKWSQDWRDVQGRGSGTGPGDESGAMPYTAPTYWGGGGPAWGGFCVHLPWEMYRRYGDTRMLEENFDTIERWLAFLETRSKGDLLRRWGGEWDFLGDWLWPGARGVNGDTRETLFFNNCYWIYNLQTAARIAEVLGRTNQLAAWRLRAEQVRRATHREFFNPSDNSYVNGSQAYLAIALYTGVPPEPLRPAVWKRLEHEILDTCKGHIHAGITGGAFLFRTLMEAHRGDLIYPMVNQQDYPGWGDMLNQGATTIWESWENNPGLSYLHSSYLFVGAWFIHGVLGIQPDPEVPGFGRFTIRPEVIDQPGLTWAKGHYDSIRGRIGAEWKRSNGKFELDIRIPPNTTALVYMPAAEGDSIAESGRRIERAKGVRFLRREGDRSVLEVQSGTYQFQSTR